MKTSRMIALIVAALSFAIFQTSQVGDVPRDVTGDKIGMVLMHGKGGTQHHVAPLGAALESGGVLVEMPLMPWSKERIYDKGYEASMREIDTYVTDLKARGAKRIIIAGHSIGANAALGYSARRKGLSGVILLAYGHVPGIPGFARKLSASTHQAREMIAAGKGESTAIFMDLGGGNSTATATSNDLLSWFDPKGPATISHNAPKLMAGTPVLCVDGSNDPRPRCRRIMGKLPDHPLHRTARVDAGHLNTPSAAARSVIDWLHTLR